MADSRRASVKKGSAKQTAPTRTAPPAPTQPRSPKKRPAASEPPPHGRARLSPKTGHGLAQPAQGQRTAAAVSPQKPGGPKDRGARAQPSAWTPPPSRQHPGAQPLSATKASYQAPTAAGASGVEGARAGLSEAHELFAREGLVLVPLENISEAGHLTVESVLQKDHFLLPGATAVQAIAVCGDLITEQQSGDPNNVKLQWEKILFPLSSRALQNAVGGSVPLAFRDLFGFLLYASREASWVLHPSVYQIWDKFHKFFEDVSAAWACVLRQPDDQLGLAPPSGRPGGYRQRLVELLAAWERETNGILSHLDHVGDPATRLPVRRARLRITG